MQVFKAFFKIAWKKKTTIFIYITVFMIICVLLTAFAQKNIKDNFTAESLTIYVEDEDETVASKALISYLGRIHTINQEQMDQSALADRIYYREFGYILKIPKGFEEALLKGESNELLTNVMIPGSNKGYYVDAQISEYLQCIQMNLAGGYGLKDAIEITQKTIEEVPEVKMASFHGEGKINSNAMFYFYQYMAYIYLLIAMTGLSPVLMTLNGKDVKARMNCSAYPFTKQLTGLIAACIVYNIFIWVLFLLMSFVLYGTAVFETKALFAALNSFVYLAFAMGLAIILSFFSFDIGVVNMIANITALASAFLCGVFVPQNLLGDAVLRIGKFLPAYWFICNNNMLAGFGNETFELSLYWRNLGVMGLFVVVVMVIALVIAKKKHNKL